MAKRKKKSKKASSNGNSAVLIIILVVVGAGFLYGFLKKEGEIGTIKDKWNEVTSSSSNEPITEKPTTKSETIESSPKSEESVKQEQGMEDFEGKVETVETNPNLPSYEAETSYYFTRSFDFAWPAYKQGDPIVEHQFYSLRYNEKTEQADWVAYKLTASNLKKSKFKRKDNFRVDQMISTESAHPNDYVGTGYDRGHLAPAADFTWSKEALDESFFMSNMSPQVPGFNRGVWKKLEEQTRDWAMENQELFVVTGPVIESKKKKIGRNKVVVPERYYKVILDIYGDEVKAIAFILPNEKSSKSLEKYALTVDQAEKATGLDFFPLIPDDLEKRIESTYNYKDW